MLLNVNNTAGTYLLLLSTFLNHFLFELSVTTVDEDTQRNGNDSGRGQKEEGQGSCEERARKKLKEV